MMKPKKIKLWKTGGKWYVFDGNKVNEFDNSLDAWQYIFLLKELRPYRTYAPKSLYPVRSLSPMPTRGCKRIAFTRL